MAAERLFKRLRQWAHEQPPTTELAGYSESLMDDLDRLYNTQRGTVLIDLQFGLPDFSELFNTMTPPELERIERALRHCTEHFEPRITVTNVQHKPRSEDFGVLRFEVSARTEFRGQQVALNYYALLGGEGRWRVQAQ